MILVNEKHSGRYVNDQNKQTGNKLLYITITLFYNQSPASTTGQQRDWSTASNYRRISGYNFCQPCTEGLSCNISIFVRIGSTELYSNKNADVAA